MCQRAVSILMWQWPCNIGSACSGSARYLARSTSKRVELEQACSLEFGSNKLDISIYAHTCIKNPYYEEVYENFLKNLVIKCVCIIHKHNHEHGYIYASITNIIMNM